MKVTVVVPVYNSQQTLQRCLHSIKPGQQSGVHVEVIVIDDGSEHPEYTHSIAESSSDCSFFSLPQNQGKAAAVNYAIARSTGEFLIQLDSDDELVADWEAVLKRIIARVPPEADLILSACKTAAGEPTVSCPSYEGRLTFAERLKGTCRGEYLAVFRGSFIRKELFEDVGIKRAGFEELSYLRFIQQGLCWIVPDVLRVYHSDVTAGLAGGWWNQPVASDRARFIELLLERYGEQYRKYAPVELKRKYLRLAVYRRLAGIPGFSGAFLRGLHPVLLVEALGSLALVLFGRRAFRTTVLVLQRVGLLRRWG